MRAHLFVTLLVLQGCAGLRPRLIDASIQKPSNVAVYFTVDTSNGEPVPGLTAEQFRIYEDDRLVSPFESKQTILNPEVAARHYTLLLLDMSGSVTRSGQLPALQAAVDRFTERVSKLQDTAVYAFDGRAELIPLRGFGPPAPLNLSGFTTKDPSTNLHGAIVKGVEVLAKQLEKSPVPLRFGTLVVFTDGTDHANRATRDQARQAIDSVDFDTFMIGVGAEIDEDGLRALSRSGAALSKDPSTVGAQFERIAERIEGFSKRFYLLSYCSPARAGRHRLTIEPFTPSGATGKLEHEFDATGFGPECDPNRKPAFDVRRPHLKKSQ
ncbi:MAG: VWA domain-containing protein [Myxococcota bacterium]